MKQLIAILLVTLVTGCTVAPVKMQFPAPPTELTKSCGDLTRVDPTNHQMSNLLNVVVENYGAYYDCKVQADAWKTWYEEQKKIFNEVFK
jgi:hypothetical protein